MYWSTPFDPRSPRHRRMWHYESGNPLSVAQLISLGSLDARTAALLWLLVERHASLIVSGPTDPTPGIGKTTTLNALLGFLPAGTSLVYTTGMYEDFEFKDEVAAETTCVLCNEVSDHLPIYMWGRVARAFLRLPEDGFAIATSCHADTIADVLSMLARDLRLPSEVIGRLGVVVNIGLVGRIWPQRRRFLTVNLILPGDHAACDGAVSTHFGTSLLPLSTWDAATDGFVHAAPQALEVLASLLGLPTKDLVATLDRRTTHVAELSVGRGVGPRAMRDAVDEFTEAERLSLVDEAADETPSDK